MVDYSKWDHFADSDSDGAEERRSTPSVRRIEPGDSPLQVGGVTITSPPTPQTSHDATGGSAPQTCADLSLASLSTNGASHDAYFWSQTRDNVRVNVVVPPASRAKDVEVKLDKDVLVVRVGGSVLLEGTLAFPINFFDAAVDPDEDWELLNVSLGGEAPLRICQIPLEKKKIMAGVSLWWNRLFVTEEKMDMAHVDRGPTSEGTSKFQENYRLAHQQFLKNIQNIEPVEIVVPPDSGDSGELPQ
mmetsp:Transcript_6824/g.19317  ORF Transcript_6824/g.19317 Transcript_6824/m.19317 type:complete len:245 (+) Transcript_6824:248-982(+)